MSYNLTHIGDDLLQKENDVINDYHFNRFTHLKDCYDVIINVYASNNVSETMLNGA